MKARIKALWRGEVSLAQAFWTVTLLYGTLINLTATGLMFAALAAGLPSLIAVAMHLLPLPYNVLALMGVWHSANALRRPTQPRRRRADCGGTLVHSHASDLNLQICATTRVTSTQ